MSPDSWWRELFLVSGASTKLARSAAPRRGPFLLWQQNAAGILARRRLGLLQCVVEEKARLPRGYLSTYGLAGPWDDRAVLRPKRGGLARERCLLLNRENGEETYHAAAPEVDGRRH
jgi:hypothetical protein